MSGRKVLVRNAGWMRIPKHGQGSMNDKDAQLRLGLRFNFSLTSTVPVMFGMGYSIFTAICLCYDERALAIKLHTRYLLYKLDYTAISIRDQHNRGRSETADGLLCNVSGP